MPLTQIATVATRCDIIKKSQLIGEIFVATLLREDGQKVELKAQYNCTFFLKVLWRRFKFF